MRGLAVGSFLIALGVVAPRLLAPLLERRAGMVATFLSYLLLVGVAAWFLIAPARRRA